MMCKNPRIKSTFLSFEIYIFLCIFGLKAGDMKWNVAQQKLEESQRQCCHSVATALLNTMDKTFL